MYNLGCSNSANVKDVGDGANTTPKSVIEGNAHDQHGQINHNIISNKNNEDACSSNDEGIFSSSNFSSPHSTAKSSPSPPKEEKIEVELQETDAKADVTTKPSVIADKPQKKSLSITFFDTLRRSFRRSQKDKNKNKSKSQGIDDDKHNLSEDKTNGGKSKKSKFKVSMPSPKTVFSSNISIESSDSNSSQSSTSGSYNTMEESNSSATWAEKTIIPMINGFNGGLKLKILPSVIAEEDEENEIDDMSTYKEMMPTSRSLDNVLDDKESGRQAPVSYESSSQLVQRSQSSRTLTATNSNIVDCSCGQKHFTVYGCLLCSHQRTGLHRAGETEGEAIKASTARLAKYCVQNYLPMPFYDLRTDQSSSGEEMISNEGEEYYKFYTTCRVTMLPTRVDRKLLVNIPAEFYNKSFTTKGAGKDYREARLQAAQKMLDKLKEANLLPVEFEYRH